MKVEAKYFRLLLNNSVVQILIALFCSNLVLAQRTQICDDNRPFYTKFLGDDTSVFITQDLFEHTSGLYSMSASVNGTELDCYIAAFRFVLMRGSKILYACQYDTVTLTTLDTLRNDIKKYEIREGDILIFTEIKVKHYCYKPCNNRYCYHDGLPMLKVIDNVKRPPRRMYMDVEKYLERNRRRKK